MGCEKKKCHSKSGARSFFLSLEFALVLLEFALVLIEPRPTGTCG
jgi:hypothetical protein